MHGSVTNRIYGSMKGPTPEVGMGATKLSWSDRDPFTVVEIINERRIIVQADDYKRLDDGGPHTESQEYEFIPNPDGYKVELSLRKDGTWKEKGGDQEYLVGSRMKYRDPHF